MSTVYTVTNDYFALTFALDTAYHTLFHSYLFYAKVQFIDFMDQGDHDMNIINLSLPDKNKLI